MYIYICVKHFGMANIEFNGGNIFFVPRKGQSGEKSLSFRDTEWLTSCSGFAEFWKMCVKELHFLSCKSIERLERSKNL